MRAMAVEFVFGAGLAQHVGHARDRNAEPRRIERRRHLRATAHPHAALPMPLVEPWPKAKPPPGNPMPPHIAASVIAAQYGCSP